MEVTEILKIRQQIITFVIAFLMLLSLVPTLRVQAATVDFKIISDSKVTAKQAKQWAKSKGATQTFIDLADIYFKYSPDHGDVNPAIAYVQAAKETGYGKFGGVLDESYHNPCGLKNSSGGGDTDQNAHQRFASWDEGIQAHLDHLALYAGVNGYPRDDSYDPRRFRSIKGTVTTVNALGGIGKWAPSATYGEEVNALYKDLMDFAKVDYPKDTNDDDNQPSSSTPNPGRPESKPSELKVNEVIPENKTKADGITVEDKPSIISSIGWKNENKAWYYYKSDNTKAIRWIKPDSNWYYLKDDGKMATDWLNDDGKWYYAEKSGKIKTGWLKDNNSWYYLQGDGSMVTDLNKIDGKNYKFNDNGTMETGWAKLSNNWYYFNADGSMVKGWISDNGVHYYLYDTGAMATGWINLNGAWYKLKDSGAITTGWVTSNGDSYYLDPSTGRMLTNIAIDGYKIGSDGKKQTSSTPNKSDNNGTNNTTTNNPSNGKKTIVIDPGHDYGKDYGAENPIDGVTYSETVLNMQVASKLKIELENIGYTVIMTRQENQKPASSSLLESLTHKVDVANDAKADFFISIHHNSASESAKGIETYYSVQRKDDNYGGGLDAARLEKSMNMAKNINDSIANKIRAINRGAKSDGSADVGTLFILRNANMPAVLVEVGFITNKEEAIRCTDPASQEKVAEAMAKAIYKNI